MNVLAKVAGLLTMIGLTAGATITWANTSIDGQVITVCPQGPPTCQFSKIQEAINAAADDAMIMVAPGTYREQGELKISKSVNLLGSEPRGVRLITDRVSIEGPIQVMIKGLAIHGLAAHETIKIYEAKVALANVDIIGDISVNEIETEAEQPKPSQLTLINVHVLGQLSIGRAAEAMVTTSELISESEVVVVTQNAQLIMSHSLIRSTNYYGGYGYGLLSADGAKVWLYDTQIEIISPVPGAVPDERSGAPAGIVADGSDLVVQRIKIFSTYHGVLAKNARLHMEASQVIAIVGWGVSLVIEPCGVRLPPTIEPSPQTFEGLITGRQNEITGARELGDVCPSALEFLKTAEGGQYP